MAFVAYDPDNPEHAKLDLLEIQTRIVDDVIEFIDVPVPEEDRKLADMTPWYYSVEISD